MSAGDMTWPDTLAPELAEFLDYWRLKRGNRALPHRSDIEPTEIPHLLHGICILEIGYADDDVDRVRFRLAGTDLFTMIGYEVTGRYVDEVMAPSAYVEVRKQFDNVIRTLQPAFRRFTWPHGPYPDVIYERVMAPLGSEGGRPDYLIGMHTIASGREMLPMMAQGSVPLG